jgi:hypothetical protein
MVKVCMILKKEWLLAIIAWKGCSRQPPPPRLLRPWEVINRFKNDLWTAVSCAEKQGADTSHTFTNMAGEKNYILCDE